MNPSFSVRRAVALKSRSIVISTRLLNYYWQLFFWVLQEMNRLSGIYLNPAKVFMLFVVTGVLTFSAFEEIRELDEGRSKKLSRILSA